jgi:Astacin (Peptidase family M12A)
MRGTNIFLALLCNAGTGLTAFTVMILLATTAHAGSGAARISSGSGLILRTGTVAHGSEPRDLWWNGLEVVPGQAIYSAGVVQSLNDVDDIDVERLAWAAPKPQLGEVLVIAIASDPGYKYVAIKVTQVSPQEITFDWKHVERARNETSCGAGGTRAANACLMQKPCSVPSLPTEVGFSRDQYRRCEVTAGSAEVLTPAGVQRLPVSVTPTANLFEGDIVLHPDQLTGQTGAARGTGRTAIAARWAGGRVPYTIDGSIADNPGVANDLWDKVQWAVGHWNSLTPLRLVAVTPIQGRPCGANDNDCVTFRRGSGCSSLVGRVGGQQFVDLVDGCSQGSVAHEIGHAVGLFHEQSAENRDKFVRIENTNIDSSEQHNFEQFSKQWSDGQDRTIYDYDSLMHYASNAFSRNGLDTIVRLDGGNANAMGQRISLSTMDLATVQAMYGPFAFSHRGALEGKSCIAVPEPDDPDTWSDNFFCASKPGAVWSYAGKRAGMNCVSVNEPADPHSWADNYLCVPQSWRESFTWAIAGAPPGDCIAFYEPSDPHAWHDNFLCWSERPAAKPLKTVLLRFRDVDDDAYAWAGGAPGELNQAVCTARYSGGRPGSSDCELTRLVSDGGLATEQKFTVKFGNGGGWDSQGTVEVVVDGVVRFTKTKSKVVRHTGWFYRTVFSINFVTGKVKQMTVDECYNVLDCTD